VSSQVAQPVGGTMSHRFPSGLRHSGHVGGARSNSSIPVSVTRP
jgi:hypothetical protein